MRPFDRLDHETPPEDLEALRDLVCDLGYQHDPFKGPFCAVEVGSWVGESALALVDGGVDRLFCVDHFEGNPADRLGHVAKCHGKRMVFETFCRNVREHLFVSIFPCVGRSMHWAEVWPFPVQLIFLDADHRYPEVWADIMAWRKHLAPGGILVGHDYGVAGLEGVKKAVDELIGPEVEFAGRTLWLWRKPL